MPKAHYLFSSQPDDGRRFPADYDIRKLDENLVKILQLENADQLDGFLVKKIKLETPFDVAISENEEAILKDPGLWQQRLKITSRTFGYLFLSSAPFAAFLAAFLMHSNVALNAEWVPAFIESLTNTLVEYTHVVLVLFLIKALYLFMFLAFLSCIKTSIKIPWRYLFPEKITEIKSLINEAGNLEKEAAESTPVQKKEVCEKAPTQKSWLSIIKSFTFSILSFLWPLLAIAAIAFTFLLSLQLAGAIDIAFLDRLLEWKIENLGEVFTLTLKVVVFVAAAYALFQLVFGQETSSHDEYSVHSVQPGLDNGRYPSWLREDSASSSTVVNEDDSETQAPLVGPTC